MIDNNFNAKGAEEAQRKVEGKCVIVSAPSGAGKTTIVKHLLTSGLGLEFSVSACSRPKRENETHGKDYYFLDIPTFQDKITKAEFVEWEEVYPGSYYGTLRSEIERIWSAGKHVIFDVDVYGGINLKKIFGDGAFSIFIMPPTVETLEERLTKRATDSAESLQKRFEKARHEISKSPEFDTIIINDVLEMAFEETVNAVKTYLEE